MPFKVKDLLFKIRLDDQVMEFQVAQKTVAEPLARVVAATCGPTNPRPDLYAHEYRIGFAGKAQLKELKEKLQMLVDGISKIEEELEPAKRKPNSKSTTKMS